MRTIQKTIKLYTYDEVIKKLKNDKRFKDVEEMVYQNGLDILHKHKDKVVEFMKQYFEFDENGNIHHTEDN